MSDISASIEIPSTPALAWRLWSDPGCWGRYVEGFARISSREGAWPEPGSVVRWDSTPHGRGSVSERVRECQPEHELVVEIEDDRLLATKRMWLREGEAGVVARIELDYRLRSSPRLVGIVVDWLFVRGALRDSLQRELEALKVELVTSRQGPR